MRDFVTSCADHLENTGLIRYADLANVGKFHHIIQKNQSLNVTTDLTKNVSK